MSQLNVIKTVAIVLVSSLGLSAHAATNDTVQDPLNPVQEYFELDNGFEAPAELLTDGQHSLAVKKVMHSRSQEGVRSHLKINNKGGKLNKKMPKTRTTRTKGRIKRSTRKHGTSRGVVNHRKNVRR